MNLFPGMKLEYPAARQKITILSCDEKQSYVEQSGENFIAKNIISNKILQSWQLTGEVDWSITPTIPIEYCFPSDPQWRKGTKVGYLPGAGIYIQRDNGGFDWISPEYVRIPQPKLELQPTPESGIDFEADPPQYGDEYIRRDGSTAKFIGMGFIGGDKWVFENSVDFLGHYNSSGKYAKDCTDSTDIISRKPAEPSKHKEKFWVNFYRNHKPDIYMAKQSAIAVRLADCLACKETEIEWTEGEGL